MQILHTQKGRKREYCNPTQHVVISMETRYCSDNDLGKTKPQCSILCNTPTPEPSPFDENRERRSIAYVLFSFSSIYLPEYVYISKRKKKINYDQYAYPQHMIYK